MRIERIAGNMLYLEFMGDTSLAQSRRTINRFQISNAPSFRSNLLFHIHACRLESLSTDLLS